MALQIWTEDRVELLKKLWDAGLSASQIAAEMGNLTRNAVIGKVHRLGLPGRPRVADGNVQAAGRSRRAKEYTPSPRQYRPRTNAKPAPQPDEEPDYVVEFTENLVPLHQRLTLLELTDDVCKWPVGDPSSPDFHFCGGKALRAYPYCAHHCRIAYQDMSEYRRTRTRR